jgi:type I restriction enzyme S subunit
MEVVSLAKGVTPVVQYYISEELYQGFINDNYIMPTKDDLLITCIGGSIGWTWIVDDSKFYYKDGNVVAFDRCRLIDTKYLYYWLNSFAFLNQVKIDVGGTAYNALTIDMLKNYLIPLPPLEEQHRIVAKIEELLPYCDRLVEK